MDKLRWALVRLLHSLQDNWVPVGAGVTLAAWTLVYEWLTAR
jgi:uncharacterized protein involved in cysteine biosynthesis